MRTTRRNATMSRRAYSLAELILGAAVLAAFTVRIFQSYAATSDADRFTKLVDELSIIVGTSRSVFTQTLSYDSFSTDLIAGVIPRGYVDGTTKPATITTPFNQPIVFTPVATENGALGGLELAFTVPVNLCERLSVGANSLYDYVAIDGGNPVKSPLTGAQATTACAASGSTDTSIKLTFTGGRNLAP